MGMNAKVLPCTIGSPAQTGPERQRLQQRRDHRQTAIDILEFRYSSSGIRRVRPEAKSRRTREKCWRG